MPSEFKIMQRKFAMLDNDRGEDGWVLELVRSRSSKKFCSKRLAPIGKAYRALLEVQKLTGFWDQVSVWRRSPEHQSWDAGHVASILLDRDAEELELVLIGSDRLKEELRQEARLEKVKKDTLVPPDSSAKGLELF